VLSSGLLRRRATAGRILLDQTSPLLALPNAL